MVLPPTVVERRFHIFMNSISYPKGSLNVLIAHFGTFSCKCGIRTEINSLFNKRGSKRRKSNSPSRREFMQFIYAHFQNKLFAYLEKHACPALLAAEGKLQSCCGESTWKSQSKPTEGTDAVLPTERLPLLSPATRFHDSGLQIPFHQLNATFVVDILSQKIHQRFVIQGDEILTQIHWYCAGTTVTFLGMAP